MDNITTVIFDMDGTLIDSERIATECWKEVFKHYNVPFDEQTIMSLKGAGRETANKVFSQTYKEHPPYNQAREMRTILFNKYIHSNDVPVLKGVKEFLSFLKQNDYKIGLATSSRIEYSTYVLTKTGLLDYFSFFVYGNEVKVGKPDPEIFLLAAQKAGSKPEECLVVEDSKYGIQAGYNGGFKVVGIPNSYQFDIKTLSMCTYVYKSMEGLKDQFIKEK